MTQKWNALQIPCQLILTTDEILQLAWEICAEIQRSPKIYKQFNA
jgi:hypothetical protein